MRKIKDQRGQVKTMVKKSKKEICELIGVKIGGLKSIEHRGKLSDRLLSVGYQLVDKRIEGEAGKQQTWFYMEYRGSMSDEEIYNTMIDNLILRERDERGEFMENKTKVIKERKKFGKYLDVRVNHSDTPISQKEIADVIGISTVTLSKWEKIAHDNKLISTDGCFYFHKIGDEVYLIDKDEYMNAMRNKYQKNFLNDRLATKIEECFNGKISPADLADYAKMVGEWEVATNGYYYKLRKWKKGSAEDLINSIMEYAYSLGLNLNDKEALQLGIDLGVI